MALARSQHDRSAAADGRIIDEADAHTDGADLPIVLSLSDMVQDADGEVVLFNDSGLRSLAISTNALVIAEGEAGRHMTAAGEDVSGFLFMTFDSGLRLYYQRGLDVIIVRERASRA